MRHDGDDRDDCDCDDDDDCDDDCDCDDDDFKNYHQLSNKVKVSQHSLISTISFSSIFLSNISELHAVAYNILV